MKVHQEREDSLRNTLVTAQKMTDEIKTNATREADLVLKEAELKAERLLEQAHRKLAQVQVEIAELARQRDLFAAKLRGLLKTHLELLDFHEALPLMDEEVVNLFVELADLNFRLQINLVIVFGAEAVLGLLAVLAHHDHRGLNGCQAGED